MAGHIQDRWYRTETGPDGKTRKVKTDRYGSGMRYRARYVGPDGTEKSKSFPDKQKRLADAWLTNIEADMARGQYIDPRAARVTFREYTDRWLGALTTDLTSRAAARRQAAPPRPAVPRHAPDRIVPARAHPRLEPPTRRHREVRPVPAAHLRRGVLGAQRGRG